MITDCATRTVTEVVDNKIKISCVCSKNQDGSVDKPTLFRADILTKPSAINKISGLEGELLLTHEDSGDIASVNKNGELILNLNGDNADLYEINDKGELIYNGE